jgi:hypothetical protein
MARVDSIHGHRTRRARHRPAGTGIQDMSVTDTLAPQETAGIAAGRHPAIGQFQRAHGDALLFGIFNADHPGLAIGARAPATQVAAKVDQQRRGCLRLQQGENGINGILLADAAQINLHAGRQGQPGRAPLCLFPTDQRQQRPNRFRSGKAVRAIKPPDPAQDAGTDVKRAVGQLPKLMREIEQARGLLVHLHGSPFGRIDAIEQVVLAVSTVFLFDAPGFRLGKTPQAQSLLRADAFKQDLAGAGHGLETERMNGHADSDRMTDGFTRVLRRRPASRRQAGADAATDYQRKE